MRAAPGGERLRVGVLAPAGAARDWAGLLPGRHFEIVQSAALADVLSFRPQLLLVLADAADAAALLGQLAALKDAPPAVVLGGEAAAAYERLLRVLARGKRDWEATFDAIVDPVMLLDAGGRVRRANLGFAAALGRPVRELIAAPYHDLLGTVDAADPIALSLADGAARTAETRFSALGSVHQVTTSPLPPAEEGEGAGLVVILKDVGPQKTQQERLERAARLADIGRLAAGIAHEINTPLASIGLRAERLRKKAEDPRLAAIDAFEDFPRYLKTIEDETARCKRITGALLDFARTRPPEVRQTDLNALVRQAVELVEHRFRARQVSLELALDPELAAIEADDGQIRQVLVALLLNACDATQARGHVRVETHGDDGCERLDVVDDGAGIPRQDLDRVMSPFFTTKPVGQGTGLGLAMAHGVVASHGGEIRVESEPGRGTRVSLRFPSRAATGETAERERP